jgi:hypothetical protein
MTVFSAFLPRSAPRSGAVTGHVSGDPFATMLTREVGS